ncbi:MAG: molecular chaperone HtpG [Selenomonadaceae bacterium]|nr:molecular chaperone HtpG [Selenomonadaceae bacterium]
MSTETLEFQAETKRLLDLVVNSIYTNKEIFLRELISNASDALDKLHFESLTNQEILEGNDDLEIFIVADSDTKTVTISDTGIGMTRDEVVTNIGTIAKSGTRAFLEKIREGSDGLNEELIGQFGVGFYSAFIVAEKVELMTRKAGESAAVKWTSEGAGEYTLEDCEKESRGTTIVLHLKPEFCGGEEFDFTNHYTIENLVKKYSDYIRYPIKMNFNTHDEDKNPVVEVRTVNSMQPLWTRSKSDIKDEEYEEFFRHQFHEWEKPMEIFHTKAEGTIEYTALLCIPKHAASNLFFADYEPGLQLYSRHVFVMDKCKDFLPDHFRFIKGLVDSPDLPLNVSREILQQSRDVKKIGRSLEKNILKQLSKILKNERERYEEFWAQFGKSLKIGVYNNSYDDKVKDDLKDLLLFTTSRDLKLSTLAEYVERMPETQKKIYCATGKDSASIAKLPQLEILREKGIEVIYLIDPVDEFAINALVNYNGKEIQSVNREDFEIDDENADKKKAELDELSRSYEELLLDIKAALGESVNEVRLTSRLKSGAVCLVTGVNGPSLNMEQTFAPMNNPFFKAHKILELNPNHALFKKLSGLHALDKNSDTFKDFCKLLYAQALLIEGILPENPVDLANKIAELMTK